MNSRDVGTEPDRIPCKTEATTPAEDSRCGSEAPQPGGPLRCRAHLLGQRWCAPPAGHVRGLALSRRIARWLGAGAASPPRRARRRRAPLPARVARCTLLRPTPSPTAAGAQRQRASGPTRSTRLPGDLGARLQTAEGHRRTDPLDPGEARKRDGDTYERRAQCTCRAGPHHPGVRRGTDSSPPPG